MTRRVLSVDLDGVLDKAALMDRCARALDLPDWFGNNWDALADVLSDPDRWPGDPVVVLVHNWRPYAEARPQEWETAAEVFASASAVTVALALGGSSQSHPGHPG